MVLEEKNSAGGVEPECVTGSGTEFRPPIYEISSMLLKFCFFI